MTTWQPKGDWAARLAADPTPQNWLQYADWLANEGDWEWREEQVHCGNTGPHGPVTISRIDLPLHQQPPYQAMLTGRLIGFLDERTHGWERCYDCPSSHWCNTCVGNLRELAEWMTVHGDPRGVEVGAFTVMRSAMEGWEMVHRAVQSLRGDGAWQRYFPTFADACRELLSRVKGMLTEPCPALVELTEPHPELAQFKAATDRQCKLCCGLGWRVKDA